MSQPSKSIRLTSRKKTRILRPVWALYFGFMGFLASCSPFIPYVGSGVSATESRTASNIQVIKNTGVFDVEILSGDREGVVLTGDDNLLRFVKTEVSGGTLKIEPEFGVNLVPTRTLKVQVTVKQVTGLQNTGTGAMTCNAPYGTNLSVEVTGTGSLTLKGSVTNLTAKCTGTAPLAAGDLSATTADLTLTGTGDATVRVANRLKVVLSGTGSVYYEGSPSADFTCTGTGRIVRR